MTAIFSPGLKKLITSKYVFLDSDFLNEIYNDQELLSQFVELTYEHCYPIIDPLIEFEFSRSITSPKEVKKMDDFIRSEIFFPVVTAQEVFAKIQSNAFILSKIYAMNGKKDNGKHASLVDLFLAGRLMSYSPGVTCIITGNARDYPQCIFDVVGVITKRQSDSKLQSFAVLDLDQDKFRTEFEKFEQTLSET